jgi:pSer/pThr/pTyr-binding forkhead associated (FHA) protein
MPATVPVLIGTAGLVQGESFLLNRGVAVVIGRSRSCDISLRRSTGYLKAAPGARDDDHDFNTVSRRHVRIEVTDEGARVEDLSTNGTFCNGQQIAGPFTADLGKGVVQIRLGTRESFDLVLLPSDDPRLAGMYHVVPLSRSDTDAD